ncbi:MAG: bifunctional DNA-formamidopyrimidine glycosylase/DNA-(apurinic or apyrimidinic site) lyase [Pseudomonadales bacterium]
MPELPEVETTRLGITPHVVGRRVTRVLVREPRLRWPVSEALGQALTGQTIEAVERRAKYLLLRSPAGTVMIHLGMSGSLRVLDATVPPEKHDHIDLALEGGQVLRFRDPRRFGSVFWLVGDDSHPLLQELGPEPLHEDFGGTHLFQRSRGRKTPVKVFLMNSQIVVGVGNIYANESLYRAGIRPTLAAGRISRGRYDRLAVAVKEVLAEAIAAGGTTLQDFVREDGSPGYFRHDLKVYGRGGAPCARCMRALTEIRLGQRTTVFCGRCQR